LQGQGAQLASHRGYDAGALVMARALAAAFKAPLVSATVSRLLVDLNRSQHNPRLWSVSAPPAVRAEIIERHYRPYRDQVERLVEQAVARGRRVVHVSSHSFTPVLHGKTRRADVGLLYDPARAGESALCARWKAGLAAADPQLRVRRNYPYAGKGDGLTAHLRRRFPAHAYLGIELEVNQRLIFAAAPRWAALRRTLIATLRTTLG
jgi:predicted N-formylglutamate amidohydrolase